MTKALAPFDDVVIHHEHEHPERPGMFRWFMAPSGMVYSIQNHVGKGWEVFSQSTGATVVEGLQTLEDVRFWARDGEEVP